MLSMMPATFARPSIRSPGGGDDGSDRGVVGDVTGDGDDLQPPGARRRTRRDARCETSTAITRPPSRATRDAVARPIPEPAPVTMTVFPANRPWVSCSAQAGASTTAATGAAGAAAASAGMSPASTRSTSASTMSWVKAPVACSHQPVQFHLAHGPQGVRPCPPWASSSRRTGPPAGSASHVLMVDPPLRLLGLFAHGSQFSASLDGMVPRTPAAVMTPAPSGQPLPDNCVR